ncbi:hypothetical protein [Clostridium botulinum]|uniref:hypothetical protein n=1 Tax=Clostridium botulinum TaxID=1491 RepID=UPI001C9AA6ED|nr:hypothetical protein [Clostridium botulinum]MBY6836551.1 hypothetical protein [Clostridium botulinum]
MQEEFKQKMDQLKIKKSAAENKLSEMKAREVAEVITEDDVRNLLSDFSGYVIGRNISECKNS